MTENDVNPADKELAALNAELDTLTADLKAALDQQATPPGGKTGIERAADLLAKAGRLVQDKLTVGEQKAALERYAQAVDELNAARDVLPGYTRLAARARTLAREVGQAEAGARTRAMRGEGQVNAARTALDKLKVAPGWIDAIRNSLSG